MSPLKKGFSHKVMSQNIHEMMQAGHGKAKAIAAAIHSAAKYKKMAKGGMVGDESEYDDDDEPEVPYAKGGMVQSSEEFDENEDPMVPHKGHGAARNMPDEESMAKMDMKGPDDGVMTPIEERINSYAMVPEDEVENSNEIMESSNLGKALRKKSMYAMIGPENYAMGGLVEAEHDSPVGNKPDEDMRDSVEDRHEEPGMGQPIEHKMNLEPKGPALSEQALEALKRNKMKRRYRQVSV